MGRVCAWLVVPEMRGVLILDEWEDKYTVQRWSKEGPGLVELSVLYDMGGIMIMLSW
jgi:hypothetical protein